MMEVAVSRTMIDLFPLLFVGSVGAPFLAAASVLSRTAALCENSTKKTKLVYPTHSKCFAASFFLI